MAARHPVRVAALVVALLALVLYARTSAFEFLVWDDDKNVSANARLDPPTLTSLASFWRAPFIGLYIPSSYSLFWLEALVTDGPDPRVYHAVSTLLHALNSALVVMLLARLGARAGGAAVGGALFALHPLQVEAVAWITEQRGLLATALGLGALLVYAGPAPGSQPGRRIARDVAALALLCLALLAKPSAVCIPVLALILELTLLRRGARFAVPRLAVAFGAAVACVLVTKSIQQDETVRELVPVAARPLVALDALEFYARKLVVPVGLAADHGRRPTLVVEHGVDGSLVAFCIAIVVALAVPAVRRRALVPLALFVGALGPVLGLVPFAYQDVSTVADRYAYVALLGPALALALAWPARASRTAWISAGAIAALLAGLSFVQSAHWRDTESVFTRVLQVNRRSWIAHTNRGLVMQGRGDLAGAQAEYEAAIAVRPDHARALNNLGIVLVQRGRAAEGEALVRRAIAAEPLYARPHMNLAAIQGNTGRLDEAEASALRAVELAPEDPSMHTTLGNVRLRQDRPREARASFAAACALRPRDLEAWIGLGTAEAALGTPSARASLETARDLARERAPARVAAIEAAIARLGAR